MRPAEPQMPGRHEDVLAALRWCLDLARDQPDERAFVRVTALLLVRAVYGHLVVHGNRVTSLAPPSVESALEELLALPTQPRRRTSHEGVHLDEGLLEDLVARMPIPIQPDVQLDPLEILDRWDELRESDERLRDIFTWAPLSRREIEALYWVHVEERWERDAASLMGISRMALRQLVRRGMEKVEAYITYRAWGWRLLEFVKMGATLVVALNRDWT